MGRLMSSLAVKVIAVGAAALVVLGGVGIAVWSNSTTSRSALAYQAKRRALDAAVSSASQQGYTSRDLAPVTSQERQLDAGAEPWWLPGRPGYFEHLSQQTGQLQVQLTALERQLVDQARADTTKQSDAAKTAIGQAQQANAPDPDVQSLQQRLDAVARAQGAAHTLNDYRAADRLALSVSQDAAALATQAQQENQQIQQAAQQIVAQNGGNLAAIQQAGNLAVANANNDASVVAYMAKVGPFKGADAVARAASRIDKYAGLIASADVNQAAQGAAAAQRYGGQVHDALMAGLPAKSVIVSFQTQHLWAYEGSKVVMETPVTTGIWGNTDFGTDFGPMKVLRKNHPWTMQSPWPKGSQYWYPDTVVQWATFFTNTGESIHDAAWEPDSLLGPGSQFNLSTRSHGCIHVPYGDAQWMFNWADVGMPVIVLPDDGSSVANQLSKITTDDQGTPKSAPH
jgi:lipoprotein-anchoring transpeptidase ErfK/SrfK